MIQRRHWHVTSDYTCFRALVISMRTEIICSLVVSFPLEYGITYRLSGATVVK
jgi:hypothetical protein